jgi:hypothetical protein
MRFALVVLACLFVSMPPASAFQERDHVPTMTEDDIPTVTRHDDSAPDTGSFDRAAVLGAVGDFPGVAEADVRELGRRIEAGEEVSLVVTFEATSSGGVSDVVLEQPTGLASIDSAVLSMFERLPAERDMGDLEGCSAFRLAVAVSKVSTMVDFSFDAPTAAGAANVATVLRRALASAGTSLGAPIDISQAGRRVSVHAELSMAALQRRVGGASPR